MTEQNEKKSMQLTEQQLTQMAQQEDAEFKNKKNLLDRVLMALSETTIAKETLKELKNNKGKIMVNIGDSVLIEVNAENIKKCKRGFAQNAYKEENVEDTIEWLNTREEQIKKQCDSLQRETEASKARLTDIIGILRQIEAEKRRLTNSMPPRISK
ncbi:MAG: hypothetical protein WCI04_00965 [archaeon]